jgi:hypothetical protein
MRIFRDEVEYILYCEGGYINSAKYYLDVLHFHKYWEGVEEDLTTFLTTLNLE